MECQKTVVIPILSKARKHVIPILSKARKQLSYPSCPNSRQPSYPSCPNPRQLSHQYLSWPKPENSCHTHPVRSQKTAVIPVSHKTASLFQEARTLCYLWRCTSKQVHKGEYVNVSFIMAIYMIQRSRS